ncbi:MAG: hypothetical protein KDK91_10740 [Gammaproteobacteria bacterium]|nr:hypothetical protein [Gammaproteobacteria bacterium]
MNGGELLVETLRSRDVDTVFFVAGGTYITVMEALSRRQDEIRAVATRLESSAMFAAEAYAAIKRKPACVFVSRAPGASNATIGVHNAMQSSRPVVLFVANIPRPMRQREAFQEIDYALMYQPVAKRVFDVNSFDELPFVVARALDLAVSGRPGPVVVSVSKDVLDGKTGELPVPARPATVRMAPEPAALREAAALIDRAERPLLLAGELVATEGEHQALAGFAEKTGVGVLAAYRQQDILDNTHPAWLGQLTLNRTPHVERAIAESDLIISIGSRLDSVTTGDYSILQPQHRFIMAYPEANEFAQWQPDVALGSHSGPVLRALTEACAAASAARRQWRDAAHAAEVEFASPGDFQTHGAVNMARVMAIYDKRVPKNAISVSDAGTFGRWLHRFYVHTQPDTSLGPVSGAMGYGVPGGIGAAVAAPGRPVFVWVGDGGFLMTGQEAAAAVQEGLPIKIIVCDNNCWGSILVSQQSRFPGWQFGTALKSPDFAALGAAYGMASFVVEASEQFEEALAGAMTHDGPALIHLKLDARDVSPYSGPAAG